MLLLICVAYFLCTGTPGSCELYKFVLSDQISDNGIIEEMSNIANHIHCATACLQQSECKGFGYTNQEKDCLLLGRFMEQDYCSKESCQTRQGMRVYMSTREITTTTTSAPTTTTTTTEATTTTTTTFPTTTTVSTTTTEKATTTTTEEPTITTTTTEPPTTTTETPTTTTTTMEPTTTTTTTKPTTTTTTESPTTTTTTTETPTTTTTTESPTTTTTTETPTTTTTTGTPTTTTTTTETPTTTTLKPTTTTLKPTTTTTLKPVTTTEMERKTVKVKCDDEDWLLLGFVSKEKKYFNDDMEVVTCYTLGQSIYADKNEVEKEFEATEKGECDEETQVITGLTFDAENSILTSYKIYCRKIKEDHIVKDKVKTVTSAAFQTTECDEKNVVKSIEALNQKTDLGQIVYEIVIKCQEVKVPIPIG